MYDRTPITVKDIKKASIFAFTAWYISILIIMINMALFFTPIFWQVLTCEFIIAWFAVLAFVHTITK
jgi:hypothetical protein